MKIIDFVQLTVLLLILSNSGVTSARLNITHSESDTNPVNYIYRFNNGGKKVHGFYVNESDFHDWLQDSSTESPAIFCHKLVNRFTLVLEAAKQATTAQEKFQLCKELLEDLQANRARAMRDCKVYLLLNSAKYMVLRLQHCVQLPDFVGEYKSKMFAPKKPEKEEVESVDEKEEKDVDYENSTELSGRSLDSPKRSVINLYSSDSKVLPTWIWLMTPISCFLKYITTM